MPCQERNNTIDVIKGFLILTVIIGHILKNPLNESILRMLIYAFHMPCFFFVSGYLLNIRKIKEMCFGGFLYKYSSRMLLQWMIAFVVFTVLAHWPNFKINNLFEDLPNPYFHLWFIPTLFTIILIFWFSSKFIKGYLFYCFVLAVSALLYTIHPIILQFGNALRINNIIWFTLGFFLRQVFLNTNLVLNYVIKSFKIIWGGILSINIFILIPIFYFCNNPWDIYQQYLQLFYCLLVCTTIIVPSIIYRKYKNDVMEFLGKQSLEIYLWHMLPLFFLKNLCKDNLVVYYGVSFSFLLLFLVVVHIVTSTKSPRQYVIRSK